MKFRVLNNKNNLEHTYEGDEIEVLFDTDVFRDNYIFITEYNGYLDSFTSKEEKDEFINYWKKAGREVISDKVLFLKEMIEHEVWTSPRGVESLFKVVDII